MLSVRFTTRVTAVLAALWFSGLASAPTSADTLYGAAHPGGPSAPSTFYTIDPGTGTATAVGAIGFFSVGGMDFQPVLGRLYAVGKRPSDGNNVLITIDPVNGTGTEIGLLNVSTPGAGGLFDLSFRNRDGVLHLSAVIGSEVFLFTVDIFTGAATAVGNTGQVGAGNALAFSRMDALKLAGTGNLVSIDDSTGAGTVTTTFSYNGFPALISPRLSAMDHRPANDTAYVAVNDGSGGSGPNFLGTLDTTSGVVTHVGGTVAGLDALAWRPDPPVSPLGKLFAVAHPGGPTTASTLYQVDPGTGFAAPIGAIGFNAVDGIDFHPTTRSLYGVGKRPIDDEDVLIVINPVTGVGNEIGPLVNTTLLGSEGLFDISWRSDGVLFLSAILPSGNVNLFTINPSTGLATDVGDTLVAAAGNGLVFAIDDSLFLSSGANLYDVNAATGLASLAHTHAFLGFPTLSNTRLTALELNPDSGIPYATVKDGTGGADVTYLGYFETVTGTVMHVGRTAANLTGLAWRPDRDPCDDVIYATAHSGGANGPSFFYELDPANGSVFVLGPVGFNGVGGLAFQPRTGRLYGIARRTSDGKNVLITVNRITGQGTEVGPLINTNLSFGGHFDLSFRRSDGTLFLLADDSIGDNALFTVNTVTGVATFVGKTGFNNRGNGMGFSLTGTLYEIDDATSGTLYTIDTASGVATVLTAVGYMGFPILTNPRVNALDVNPGDGTMFAAVNDGNLGAGPNYLATLNTATGVLTHVGQSISGLDSLAVRAGCEDLDDCTIDVCAGCQGQLYGAAHSGGPGGASELRRIDSRTGNSIPIGPIGFNDVGGIDFHPTLGLLYGVGKRPADGVDVAIAINPDSGQGTEIGPLVNTDNQGGGGHFDVSFRDSDGVLFLTAFDAIGNVTLYTVDLASGTATAAGGTGTAGTDQGLGFSVSDLYHADETAGGTLYTLDQALGTATVTTALAYSNFPSLANPRPNAIDFDPCSTTAAISIDDGFAGSGPNYLATLDAATGEVKHIGQTLNGLDALAWREVAARECINTLTPDDDMDGVCEALDNCPEVANPAQGVVLFPETVLATSKTRQEWTTPNSVLLARLSSDIANYATNSIDTLPNSNSYLVPAVPAPGFPLYFLVRINCPAGTWASGGPSECLPPGVCPVGERDGSLP